MATVFYKIVFPWQRHICQFFLFLFVCLFFLFEPHNCEYGQALNYPRSTDPGTTGPAYHWNKGAFCSHDHFVVSTMKQMFYGYLFSYIRKGFFF